MCHRLQTLPDRVEQRPQPSIGMGEECPDEHAVPIDGERRHVFEEGLPRSALEQILLDVRRVECDYRCVVVLDVAADCPNRFRTGEVSHQRHDQVVGFVLFQCLKVPLGFDEAMVVSVEIGLGHEFRIRRNP